MPAFRDLTGQKFHRLTVVSLNSRKNGARWLVRCDCGTERVVRGGALTSGHTKSCGCLKSEIAAQNGRRWTRTHGMSRTRTYQCWGHLRQRCTNPNDPAFPRYGGRGITVCDRWKNSFENFLADMGERPDGMEIDRIDNDGPYSPDNCRWTTTKTNSRNRRSNRVLTISMTLVEWAEWAGLDPGVIGDRLRYGWTEREAVFGRSEDHG